MPKCPTLATYRYTWPGRDEAYVCAIHAQQLSNIAQAMGLHLQILPLSYEQMSATCSQNIKEESEVGR
jgi:hypothetical protein